MSAPQALRAGDEIVLAYGEPILPWEHETDGYVYRYRATLRWLPAGPGDSMIVLGPTGQPYHLNSNASAFLGLWRDDRGER